MKRSIVCVAAVVAIWALGGQARAGLTDGLVTYLPFDDGTLTDAVGSADGIVQQAGDWTVPGADGRFGGYANKVTTNQMGDGHIEIPLVPGGGGTSFTITHWIYRPGTFSDGWHMGAYAGWGQPGFFGSGGGTRLQAWDTSGNNTGNEWYGSDVRNTMDSWVFEVVRFDASATSLGLGVKVRALGAGDWMGNGGWWVDPEHNKVTGNISSGATFKTGWDPYVGYREDELAIWDRALTDAKLDQLFSLTAPLSSLLGGPAAHAGDANKDGTVDLQDFGLLKDNFGATAGALWTQGDFNGDHAIDLQDFGILKDHFGHSAGDSPLAAVPEPATMSLLALGALAAIRRARR